MTVKGTRLQDQLAVRKAIRIAAARTFGREVAIEERVFQALEVGSRRSGKPYAFNYAPNALWTSVSSILPAIAEVHVAVGADLRAVNVPWPKETQPPKFAETQPGPWVGVLRQLFERPPRALTHPMNLNLVGETVAETGDLTIRDLTAGILAARFPVSPSINTTLVIGALARGAGLPVPGRWTPALEEFQQRAIAAVTELAAIDESLGDQQFLLFHDGARYRLRPFGVHGGYALRQSETGVWLARGNKMQLGVRFSHAATRYLETLINSNASEDEFQYFFEKHPEFLLALGNYRNLHAQLILRSADGNLIPDFFLERVDVDLADICDLKLPTSDLVRNQRNRLRFKDAVREAIAQLETYRDWFEDPRHRDAFAKEYGLKVFRPQIVVVIGRRRSFADDIERIRLESRLPRWVGLRTYDDVLESARNWQRIVDNPL